MVESKVFGKYGRQDLNLDNLLLQFVNSCPAGDNYIILAFNILF